MRDGERKRERHTHLYNNPHSISPHYSFPSASSSSSILIPPLNFPPIPLPSSLHPLHPSSLRAPSFDPSTSSYPFLVLLFHLFHPHSTPSISLLTSFDSHTSFYYLSHHLSTPLPVFLPTSTTIPHLHPHFTSPIPPPSSFYLSTTLFYLSHRLSTP